MIKAVVFDLDNTLYDYDKCNVHAENALYKSIVEKFGLSKTESKKKLYEAKKIIKNRLGNTAAAHNRLLYMQTLCELIGKNPLLYAKSLYDCYWNELIDKMELFDYVVPLLTYLRKEQIKVAVLTDLTAHIQYRKIEKLGLTKDIDVLVTSEEVGEEKPSHRMFDLIHKKLGCRLDEILMVGDSLEKDVNGAKEAGMQAIHYKKGIKIEEKVIKSL